MNAWPGVSIPKRKNCARLPRMSTPTIDTMRMPKTVTMTPATATQSTQRGCPVTTPAAERGPRSNRMKIATRAAVGIASTANHTGRLHHQAALPTSGNEMPSAPALNRVKSSAVRCQRKAVIANAPAVTTPRHTRGRASTRAIGPRANAAIPMSARPWHSRATVGGDMFEISSPGSPTIDTG